MKNSIKRIYLLKRSLLLILGLNTFILTALPIHPVRGETLTPSMMIPNLNALDEKQANEAMMRFEVQALLQSMPLNTERLKQAANHFKSKEDEKARAALDINAITQEQNNLLEQLAKKPEVQAQLDDLAVELVLLARLTEINYALGDERISKAGSYFEQALKSGRNSEVLYQYAQFAQHNKQNKLAENLLSELVAEARKQAATKPESLGYLTMLLSELGSMKQANDPQSEEGYQLQVEALTNTRQVLASTPEALEQLALSLSNLWMAFDSTTTHRDDIIKHYAETIETLRPLAANQAIYAPAFANTLNIQAIMLQQSDNASTQQETIEKLYTEAIALNRKLASAKPNEHLPNVAMTLAGLGSFLSKKDTRHGEAEKLMNEALSINRQLAATHPDPYLRDLYQGQVIRTLEGLADAYIDWKQADKARSALEEALTVAQTLAKAKPDQYGMQVTSIQEALKKLN